MRKNKIVLLITTLIIGLALIPASSNADPYSWSMTIGGTGYDQVQSIQQTADGGYIAAGFTASFGGAGNKAWVLKVNADGSVAWQNIYDGTSEDLAYSVQQTADGGYIVAGHTNSFGLNSYNAWVMKLNANGSVAWQNTYGGTNAEYAYSIRQTADGGYIVAGAIKSYGAGGFDAWVLKLNANGSVAWQKAYGGALDDYAQSIQQTADGGYIVAGYTLSTGAGNNDAWVLKLNADGSVAWQKTYGGTSDDRAYSVQQTADGGYIVAGYTNSFGAGSTDAWVLKLNADGSVAWQKTYGNSNDDRVFSIQQTADGGYIVAGYTDSSSSGTGSHNAWVLKLNADGGVAWQKTYGGTNEDHANAVQQTADGGYIVAGYTLSTGAGGSDAWVMKLDSSGRILDCSGVTIADSSATVVNTATTGTTSTATVTATALAPSASAATVTASAATASMQCAYTASPLKWQKTYGGSGFDVAKSVEQTTDGGYIVAGYTDSSGAGSKDAWVLKLNADGTVNWQKTYGGGSDDFANSVQQTADGGYIVAGYSGSFAAGSAWVIKLNAAGTVAWQKEYEAGCVEAHSIKQTADGGYIVAGWGPAINANSDAWVMKLTSDGSVTWQRAYGGTAHEEAFSIQQTADGGYIFAGFTESYGAGNADAWVMKLNSDGSIAWQKTYGGAEADYARSIHQTADGGYVVAGYTYSFGTDDNAAWVLKLDANGNVGPAYPGTWQKIYGGTNNDTAYSVRQTADGGYIVAGSEYSEEAGGKSAWVLKLNADGSIAWQNTYKEAATFQEASSVRQTADGGYIVAGYKNTASGKDDVWVMKLDQNGGISGCGNVVAATGPVQNTTGSVNPTAISPYAPNSPVTQGPYTVTIHSTAVTPVTVCPADYSMYLLDLFISGFGTGSVTSSPSGINCTTDCSAYFTAGALTLSYVVGPGAMFAGWGGACDAGGHVSMDADKSCTATFSCIHKAVNVGSNYYDAIQTAYTAAGEGDTLLLQAQGFYETLSLTSIGIKLSGGYGCDYSSNPGRSTLYGSMTIKGGKVTVDKLTIR